MADEAILRLLQSMIDLHVKMNSRIDTLLWRLERTEREVGRLNELRLIDEVTKTQVEGGGK